MILAIRTDTETAELYLLQTSGKVLNKHTWQAGRELSKELLQQIRNLLKQGKTSFKDLEGIVVYKGPGSFTGLRIGVSVANAVAYSLDTPVVGTSSKDWLADGSQKLSKAKIGQFVVPEYGAAPNITKPKK